MYEKYIYAQHRKIRHLPLRGLVHVKELTQLLGGQTAMSMKTTLGRLLTLSFLLHLERSVYYTNLKV